jgi:hypothetical protein
MITETRNSKINLIIEHISDSINTVVQAIAADPLSPAHNASWKKRFPSIEDLNVLTATNVDDYLPTTVEYPDRYPAIYFGIDQAVPNPALSDAESFIGRLFLEIIVNRENFKMAQREFFEIHDALRTIILHDKSIGVINSLGGIIDQIQWIGFSDLVYDRLDMREFILGGRAAFEIAFLEDVNR